jgi:hypothetical protein
MVLSSGPNVFYAGETTMVKNDAISSLKLFSLGAAEDFERLDGCDSCDNEGISYRYPTLILQEINIKLYP